MIGHRSIYYHFFKEVLDLDLDLVLIIVLFMFDISWKVSGKKLKRIIITVSNTFIMIIIIIMFISLVIREWKILRLSFWEDRSLQ